MQLPSDFDIFALPSVPGRRKHAEFVGNPMMAAQFDTVYYDQITGKEMQAYFADNELYRMDVNGNVQTIFFQKDGVPQEVVMMAVIESGDAPFFIEERQCSGIEFKARGWTAQRGPELGVKFTQAAEFA